MVKILSLDDFTAMVKAFQKGNPKSFTNCFLMPDELKTLIQCDCIYVSQQKDWFFIVCERCDYYNLYFYSSASPCTPDIDEIAERFNDKQIFVDVVLREGISKSNYALNVLLENEIVVPYKSYKRMNFVQKTSDDKPYQDAQMYRMVCEYGDTEALFSLWKSALDEKSTPLPLKKDVLALEKEGKILYIVDKDNYLCAVGMLNVQGRNALIQHIAVSSLHRRKGLAKYIVSKLIDLSTKKEMRTLKLWVDCENIPAVKLYDKIGFVNDGMICNQFEFKTKGN